MCNGTELLDCTAKTMDTTKQALFLQAKMYLCSYQAGLDVSVNRLDLGSRRST